MAETGSSRLDTLSSSTFDAYNVDIQGAALTATKLAATLPDDIGFHRSVDRDFAQAIDTCSGRVLELTNRLLQLVTTTKASNARGKFKLETEDDVQDRFGSVVIDAMDNLLERADICLDEYLGRSKPAAIEIKPPPPSHSAMPKSRQERLDPSLTHASHLPKPQLKFNRKVDNTNHSIWRPVLRHKYNAQVPLGYNLHTTDADGDIDMRPLRTHPYRHEIKHISYPKRMFQYAEAIPPRSFNDTPFTWIDTKVALEAMLEKLRVSKELAVDLEHHSYRSFSGFLCLMQISTRDEDFIIDTLVLRDELEELNEVFTDPDIIKVFHGAESDIVWLQQDFNLYIVNLFDTFHASTVLDFPRHGLAALLAMYCDFLPDKRFQLADWRIRPLPQEMLKYARSDTHFLLYIYDNLRNALLDRAGSSNTNLVRTVLDRSEQTALRTYEIEDYDVETGAGAGGWDTLAQKWNKTMSGLQMAVFRCAHAWRDAVAREEDESTRYVLPNHYLFQLAEQQPADMASLLPMFRPVPPLIRTRAKDLLETIRATVKEYNPGPNSAGIPHVVALTPGNTSALESEAVNDSANVEVFPSSMNAEATQSPRIADDLTRLWSNHKTDRHIPVSLSSSLLGSKAVKSKPPTSDYSTTISSLFPSAVTTISSSKFDTATRYSEVVARIHSALVIAPSIPKVLADAANRSTKPADDYHSHDSPPMTQELPSSSEAVEIPYVPASHRRQIVPEIDDTVVVVGQARQKKRKRVKSQVDVDSKESTPSANSDRVVNKKAKNKAKEEAPTAEEPFDYADVPNMLDDQPDELVNSSVRKGKERKQKGAAFEYGNFPAPPRAYSELKGGNRSHTFR